MEVSTFTLFVGNLSFSTTADSLRAAFAAFSVVHVHLVVDLETNRSRGFALVTLSAPGGLAAVITETNGVYVDGRAINVQDAAAPNVVHLLSFVPDNEKPAELRSDASSSTTLRPKRVNWQALEQTIRSAPSGFLIHEGNTTVDGDLILDGEICHFVCGDLDVKGNILALDDNSSMVIVAGNCRAKNFISGGLGGCIKGDLLVDNALVADYNHGRLIVEGNISGRLVTAEHELVVRGAINARTVDFGGFLVDDPTFRPDISQEQVGHESRKLFVREILNMSGVINGGKLIQRALAGLPVLRDEQAAVPPTDRKRALELAELRVDRALASLRGRTKRPRKAETSSRRHKNHTPAQLDVETQFEQLLNEACAIFEADPIACELTPITRLLDQLIALRPAIQRLKEPQNFLDELDAVSIVARALSMLAEIPEHEIAARGSIVIEEARKIWYSRGKPRCIAIMVMQRVLGRTGCILASSKDRVSRERAFASCNEAVELREYWQNEAPLKKLVKLADALEDVLEIQALLSSSEPPAA